MNVAFKNQIVINKARNLNMIYEALHSTIEIGGFAIYTEVIKKTRIYYES